MSSRSEMVVPGPASPASTTALAAADPPAGGAALPAALTFGRRLSRRRSLAPLTTFPPDEEWVALAATMLFALTAFPPGEGGRRLQTRCLISPRAWARKWARRPSRRWSHWHEAQWCSRQQRLPVLPSRAADAQQRSRAAGSQQLPSSHSSSVYDEVRWCCTPAPRNAGPQATHAAVRQQPPRAGAGLGFALGFCARRVGTMLEGCVVVVLSVPNWGEGVAFCSI